MDCSACLNCGMVVLLNMTGCRLFPILMVIIIIIIRQPLCPVVGRRPQHAVSKLPCLVLSSAYRVAPVLVQVVSPPFVWSPLSSFLVIWSPFFSVLILSMTFVLSMTQMLVFLSLYVMLSMLLSILVCAAASLFCAFKFTHVNIS